jgi:hypothetical protein
MAVAIAALSYRWKSGNEPLLLLVIGFSFGFLLSFAMRLANRRRKTEEQQSDELLKDR